MKKPYAICRSRQGTATTLPAVQFKRPNHIGTRTAATIVAGNFR
jgi:hypothetical protein